MDVNITMTIKEAEAITKVFFECRDFILPQLERAPAEKSVFKTIAQTFSKELFQGKYKRKSGYSILFDKCKVKNIKRLLH